MAKRSTRQKIRDSAKKAIEDIERCQTHLMYLDQLADGNSDYIENHLPSVVFMSEEFLNLVKLFFEGL